MEALRLARLTSRLLRVARLDREELKPQLEIIDLTVEHPEQFPLATATAHPTTSELVATGTVTPDVSRNVPVVSFASGRVTAIHARLGDMVKKGQLLLTV